MSAKFKLRQIKEKIFYEIVVNKEKYLEYLNTKSQQAEMDKINIVNNIKDLYNEILSFDKTIEDQRSILNNLEERILYTKEKIKKMQISIYSQN